MSLAHYCTAPRATPPPDLMIHFTCLGVGSDLPRNLYGPACTDHSKGACLAANSSSLENSTRYFVHLSRFPRTILMPTKTLVTRG
jgi:hypothetical protein